MISFQIGTSQQAFAHYIREAIRQWHCQRRWLPGRYKNKQKSRTLTEIFFAVLGEERRPSGAGGEGRRYQVVHTILHLAQGGRRDFWCNLSHLLSLLSQQISRKHCAIDQILIICTFRRRRRKISWLWLFWWYLQEIFCKNIFAREVESRFRLLLFHTAAPPPSCWHDKRRLLSSKVKVIEVKLKKF